MAVSHVYNQTVADGTATSVVRPSDWNSAHNHFITLLGNTAGASTVSGTDIYFAGGNNVTLSVSQAAGVATVSFGNAAIASWWENIQGGLVAATQTLQPVGSTQFVFPFFLDGPVSASYIRMPVSWALTSTSLATSAVPTSTTFSVVGTHFAVIYSQNTGANSRSLAYVTSGSAGWTWQVSATIANATNNWTLSNNFTYPSEGANTANTQIVRASTLSTVNINTSVDVTNFTGIRYLDIPLATQLLPGNYWMALMQTTTTGGGKGLNMMFSHIVLTQPNAAIGNLNAATNSSLQFQVGLGSWTTNTQNSTSSIGLASISSSASQPRPYFQLIRQA